MSENLDPEDVSNIIQPLFQECNAAINKYGGVVEKFIGDAIMALFGVPYAHEDDPERAALAALELRDIIQAYGAKLEKSMGFSLDMRIGLNVGTVVAGSVEAIEGKNYQVMGDAINTAARMEQNARPGHILVTEDMYRMLRDGFNLRPDKLLNVKGKAMPIRSYELLGNLKHQQLRRGFENRAQHFVGRGKELGNLEAWVSQAISANEPAFVLLSGESGLGKSRLAQEAWQIFAGRGEALMLLNGSSTSYSKDFAYFMLQSLLRSAINAEDSLSQTDVQQRIQQLVQDTGMPNADMTSILLEYVLFPHLEFPALKLISPDRLQQQIFKAISDVLMQLARSRPMFVQIDDLQWCDSLSLQWLSYFQRAVEIQKLPIIFCITCRQSDGGDSISWDRRSQLQPLTEAECTRLICAILATDSLPASLKPLTRAILDRAAGNPFYIEEVFKILLEDRMLLQTDNLWELTCELKDLPLPSSVQRLVMSRFDRLPENLRNLMQTLSAMGRSSPLSLVQQLQGPENTGLRQELQDLEATGFILLKANERDTDVIFRQTLAQEVIYSTMVNRRKRLLHFEIATALEQLNAGDLSSVLDLLAFHYARTSETALAIRYLWLSAEQATRLYANELAVVQLDLILELLDKHEPQTLIAVDLLKREWLRASQLRQKVVLNRLDVLLMTGAYDAVLTSVASALAENPSQGVRAGLLYCRGRVLEKRSEFTSARELYEEARALYHELSFLRGEARMYNAIGWVLRWMGDYAAANQACQSALGLLEQQPDMEQLAYAHNVLGWVALSSHQFDDSLSHFREALDIQEQINDQWGRGNSLINIGSVYSMTNRWPEAITCFCRSIEIKEQLGDLDGLSNAYNNLGHANQELGQLDQAEAALDQALQLYGRLGNVLGVAVAYCNLGSLAFRRRQWERSLELLNRGIEAVRERNMDNMLPEALNHRIEICLEIKNDVQSYSLLQSDSETIRSHGDPIQKGRLDRLWGQWHARQGDSQTALSAYKLALALLQPTDHRGECQALYRELGRLHRSLNSSEAQYWEELSQQFVTISPSPTEERLII